MNLLVFITPYNSIFRQIAFILISGVILSPLFTMKAQGNTEDALDQNSQVTLGIETNNGSKIHLEGSEDPENYNNKIQQNVRDLQTNHTQAPPTQIEAISLEFFDPNELYDFSAQLLTPNDNINLWDTTFCLENQAIARRFYQGILQKYDLQSSTFQLGDADSDILSRLTFWDQGGNRKCSKCNMMFNHQHLFLLHLIRDHLPTSTQNIRDNNNKTAENHNKRQLYVDSLCSFIDCSRDGTESLGQSEETAKKRLAACLQFSQHNIQERIDSQSPQVNGNLKNNEKPNHSSSMRSVYQMCHSIAYSPSNTLVQQEQSSFSYYLWKIGFWLMIATSFSYYSVILLTPEGRRAWLTPVSHD